MSLALMIATARRAPPWTLSVAAASAVLFALLATLVALGLTRVSDLGWTRAFQSLASYPLDLAVNAHTIVGLLNVTLPIAAILALIAWRRLGGHAWLGPLLILATGGIELAFKTVVPHPSPPVELVRAFAHLGPPPEWQPPFAFPSGHVARLSFLTLVVGGLWPRPWVTAAGAAFVAFSVFARVYIGDHWISDALGGLMLGTAVGALAVGWMHATARI
ncbi:MAG TPA: phosphatase PAP2 family protein [Candidatus Limnocylindria bacterium]